MKTMQNVRRRRLSRTVGFRQKEFTTSQLGKQIRDKTPRNLERVWQRRVMPLAERHAKHQERKTIVQRDARRQKDFVDGLILDVYGELKRRRNTIDEICKACLGSEKITKILEQHGIRRAVLSLRITALHRKGKLPTIIRVGRAAIRYGKKKPAAQERAVAIPDKELIRSPWYKELRRMGVDPLIDAYKRGFGLQGQERELKEIYAIIDRFAPRTHRQRALKILDSLGQIAKK